MLVMWTWVRGSRYLFDKTRRNEIPLDFLAGNLLKKKPQLVSGTAVFLTSDPLSAPTALMHSLKHYKVLHEQNVILSVVTAPQPVVPDSERVKMETVNELFMRVTLTFGYMETAQHPARAGDLPQAGLEVRHHDDVVLPVAALAQGLAQFRHAVVAGPAVHRAGAHGRRRDGIFPDSDRTRGRNRHAGGDLRV